MRNYRNILAALVFVFALSATAFADDGIIYTDRTPPTTTATSTTQSSTTDGASDSSNAATQSSTASDATADNSITAAVISLVQSALTLI